MCILVVQKALSRDKINCWNYCLKDHLLKNCSLVALLLKILGWHIVKVGSRWVWGLLDFLFGFLFVAVIASLWLHNFSPSVSWQQGKALFLNPNLGRVGFTVKAFFIPGISIACVKSFLVSVTQCWFHIYWLQAAVLHQWFKHSLMFVG